MAVSFTSVNIARISRRTSAGVTCLANHAHWKRNHATISIISPRINPDRFNATLHETCRWGAAFPTGLKPTETGMARLSLDDNDAKVRRWFAEETASLGCDVKVDKLGNMFAIRPGKNKGAPTAIGSHLDTQPTGGRYDGILGVQAGVEALRTLHDAGIQTNYPVAVVNWTNEEGARFPKSMVGSAVWAGDIPLEDAWALKEVGNGQATMRTELERIGFLGEIECSYEAMPLAAHFELHIEQGPILEAERAKIGVVLGGQAYRWYTIEVQGRECHTGATPYYSRSDALLCASRIIVASNTIAKKHKGLASTGVLSLTPGSTNTCPGRVKMSLDIRHPDAAALDIIDQEIQAEAERIARDESEQGCQLGWTVDFNSPAIRFSDACINIVRSAASDVVQDQRMKDIFSGAGHDSCSVSKRCPTSMIFIPCRDGLSHNPHEYASPEDCATGAQVILNAVLAYDDQRLN